MPCCWNEASRHKQFLIFTFEAGGLQDCIDRLLLGGLDERAGVHDDRVRLGSVGDDFMAAGFEQAAEVGGVGDVFEAAEGDDRDLLFRRHALLYLFAL